jgi:hypothetical protein
MTTSSCRQSLSRSAAALIALSAVFLLSACAQLQPPKPPAEAPKVAQKPPPVPPPPEPAALYQWYGDGRTVSHIEVDVDEQKAVFYDGPHQIGWAMVASGIRSYPTPTGRFAVTEKIVEKRSNLYGKIYNSKGKLVRRNAEMGVHPIPAGGRFEGAKMPYFMRLTNDGIGMHAGPIPKPGRPASHGCIRMPYEMAPVLYQHVSIGTPVSIVGSGPSYERYLAAQRAKAKKRAPAAAAETTVAATAQQEGAPANAGSETPTTTTPVTAQSDTGPSAAPTVSDGPPEPTTEQASSTSSDTDSGAIPAATATAATDTTVEPAPAPLISESPDTGPAPGNTPAPAETVTSQSNPVEVEQESAEPAAGTAPDTVGAPSTQSTSEAGMAGATSAGTGAAVSPPAVPQGARTRDEG